MDNPAITPQSDLELRVASAIIRAEQEEWRREFPTLPERVYPASERGRVLLAARAAIATLVPEEVAACPA